MILNWTVGREGISPYELHHIDGDNNNWVESNIEILCLNCHWKTPNWRFRGRKHTDEAKKKISDNHHTKNK